MCWIPKYFLKERKEESESEISPLPTYILCWELSICGKKTANPEYFQQEIGNSIAPIDIYISMTMIFFDLRNGGTKIW